MTTWDSPQAAASDWAAARGEKWLAQLSGMEAMLAPVDEPLLRALQLDGPSASPRLERRRRDRAGDFPPGAGGKRDHGFDISPALVEVARRRIGPGQQGALAFRSADMATAAPPRPAL